MFCINASGEIYITRGDSAAVDITITDAAGAPYTLSAGDTLIMSVKRTVYDDDALLVLDATSGQVRITPCDTAGWVYGEYVYDVQLTTGAGDVYTVVPPTRLEICPEVSV